MIQPRANGRSASGGERRIPVVRVRDGTITEGHSDQELINAD